MTVRCDGDDDGLTPAKLFELPGVADNRGRLTFIEQKSDVPFAIERVYYLYDFSGKRRGGHAHKELEQVMIALSGALDVRLDDGVSETTVTLDDPSVGLYVPPATWRVLEDFRSDPVCLVVASRPYEEDDYIRDYSDFLDWCDPEDD